MKETVAIVGAGVLGRLLALGLHDRGWEVTIWDRGNAFGSHSCSHAAAGMLAPYCELESADEVICRLGEASLALWPRLLGKLNGEVFFQRRGSLCVAHPTDQGELLRLKERVLRVRPHAISELSAPDLSRLEPELDTRFRNSLYLESEGHVDTRQFLSATTTTLREKGIGCFFGEEILEVAPGRIATKDRSISADWVLDTRGLGAKPDLTDLRGVRGELLIIEAPEVNLQRPVRVMHPRYPLYVVPRPSNRYLVGATVIESEDWTGVSVRSTLELLSAAFALHSGFAEGRVIESVVHCRPAFANNLPSIRHRRGLLRINGLYRHGFLLSPRIAELTADFLEKGFCNSEEGILFEEVA